MNFFPLILKLQHTFSQMNTQKYTRAYLTNLPIEMRKQHIAQVCQEYINPILAEARNGNTSCLVSIPDPLKASRMCNPQQMWSKDPPSKEEMAEFLQERFPDCKVSYEEAWIDTSPGKKELKKGILVDWS